MKEVCGDCSLNKECLCGECGNLIMALELKNDMPQRAFDFYSFLKNNKQKIIFEMLGKEEEATIMVPFECIPEMVESWGDYIGLEYVNGAEVRTWIRPDGVSFESLKELCKATGLKMVYAIKALRD